MSPFDIKSKIKKGCVVMLVVLSVIGQVSPRRVSSDMRDKALVALMMAKRQHSSTHCSSGFDAVYNSKTWILQKKNKRKIDTVEI